jgi:excisionase family DNA binding protein
MGEVLSGSHPTLDALFEAEGAPGPPPALNPDTIYKWITRKSMPAHKLGRLWKFLAFEVDAWVKGGHAAEDIEGRPKSRQERRSRG